MSRKDAISFLNIPEKHFDNYFKFSKEIVGKKISGRWEFSKEDLICWKRDKEDNTVKLPITEYEECFQFAIKMAYASNSRHGTGIRGQRSEVQMADDFILGILAEHGVAKFIEKRFDVKVSMDEEVHPDHITPQDVVEIEKEGNRRKPGLGIAIKSSKLKNCFNIIDPLEYENCERKSDAYIFVRVDLPSDHLFRTLRDHSFFKTAREFLESHKKFRKIETLRPVPVWVCGFSYHNEFKKVTRIPRQEFEGERYVKSVGEMHKSAKDWKKLIDKL